MSDEARALKLQQMEDYFDYHPDNISVSILDGDGGSVVTTINALFDHPARGVDARKQGAVEFHRRYPHITFYTGHVVDGTISVGTYLVVNSKQWRVRELSDTYSEGTYQTIAWLVGCNG